MNGSLYLRKNRWWIRAAVRGKKQRFSTRTSDRATAERVLKRFMATCNAELCSETWSATVDGWMVDSDSWLNRTYRHMRNKSKRRSWHDLMSRHELADLARRSDGRCGLTGLPFEPAGPFSISIDRIDCDRGYSAGNCRIVCLMANIAMRHWGEHALRRLAIAYTANIASTSGVAG